MMMTKGLAAAATTVIFTKHWVQRGPGLSYHSREMTVPGLVSAASALALAGLPRQQRAHESISRRRACPAALALLTVLAVFGTSAVSTHFGGILFPGIWRLRLWGAMLQYYLVFCIRRLKMSFDLVLSPPW